VVVIVIDPHNLEAELDFDENPASRVSEERNPPLGRFLTGPPQAGHPPVYAAIWVVGVSRRPKVADLSGSEEPKANG